MDAQVLSQQIPKDFSTLIDFFQYGGFVLFLFALTGELALRWSEGKSLFSKDGPGNIVLFSFGPILETLIGTALLTAGLIAVYAVTPLRIPITWWTLPIYILAAEFCIYWAHREMHEVRLFWADHMVHHSSEEYDFTTNLRHHPMSTFIRLLAWTPVVLLGFHPVLLVILANCTGAFQTFAHTQRIRRLSPWFEWTFVTPSNHIVHHACNPEYLDKNYGGLLMIWDHVFGTYQALRDDVPVKLGITKPIHTSNPFKTLAIGYQRLWRDFKEAPGANEKFKVLFGRPGQTFEASYPETIPAHS